ncbi:hypothetical protein BT69DRAFT_1284952, partial [Atractiella rhizophila]
MLRRSDFRAEGIIRHPVYQLLVSRCLDLAFAPDSPLRQASAKSLSLIHTLFLYLKTSDPVRSHELLEISREIFETMYAKMNHSDGTQFVNRQIDNFAVRDTKAAVFSGKQLVLTSSFYRRYQTSVVPAEVYLDVHHFYEMHHPENVSDFAENCFAHLIARLRAASIARNNISSQGSIQAAAACTDLLDDFDKWIIWKQRIEMKLPLNASFNLGDDERGTIFSLTQTELKSRRMLISPEFLHNCLLSMKSPLNGNKVQPMYSIFTQIGILLTEAEQELSGLCLGVIHQALTQAKVCFGDNQTFRRLSVRLQEREDDMIRRTLTFVDAGWEIQQKQEDHQTVLGWSYLSEFTQWFDLIGWDRLAEFLVQYPQHYSQVVGLSAQCKIAGWAKRAWADRLETLAVAMSKLA